MRKISHMEKSLKQRQTDSQRIMQKYPERICIYIEKAKLCKNIQDLDNHKYLIPNTITVAQFIYVIRSKITIPNDQALFFYVNNSTLISGDTAMIEINNKHKNEDGFLYINYSGESCFG